MEIPVHVSEILRGIDLAWWPEILLTMTDQSDEDVTVDSSLMIPATFYGEEDSLA